MQEGLVRSLEGSPPAGGAPRGGAAGPPDLIFQSPRCPAAFATTRHAAEEQLDRLPIAPFSQKLGMPRGDFMCAFCHLCRNEVVDRLTGGAFQVRDLENTLQAPAPGRGVCRFRVEPRAEATGEPSRRRTTSNRVTVDKHEQRRTP